jgi:tetratricopeptide (TPR) repeat protein
MLERALALSPRNSQFLSELASIYQGEKNWTTALQTYQLAEAAAREFSPPQVKDAELSRAWRGIGFVLVEQNRLDAAEKMYRQCLELNKNDSIALKELSYVLNLKAKKGDQ